MKTYKTFKQTPAPTPIIGDSANNISIATEESVKSQKNLQTLPATNIIHQSSEQSNLTPQKLLQEISKSAIQINEIIVEDSQRDKENDSEQNGKLFAEHLLKSILSNTENIPHDPKFPYLDEFANKTKGRDFKNISEIIKESNNEITKASNQNLIFSGVSTTIGATANLTNYGLVASGGVALPWLIAVTIVPAMVNFVHKVKNGVDLNAYLEGRGYLLKYCENVAIMLICDVAERIKNSTDEDKTAKEGAVNLLKSALKDLQKFNLEHYDPEPFYYKWLAQACRQGSSNALSGARFGMGVASVAGAVIAPPVGMAITGLWVGSEAIGGCLYKKSHNLRNAKSITASESLDLVLKNIFTIYRDYLKIETIEQMQDLELEISPDKAKEELRKLCKEYEILPNKKIAENIKSKENKFPSRSSKSHKHCNHHEHHHHEENCKHSPNHNTNNRNKHQHSHNWQNRYIEDNCSHNLGDKISQKKLKFNDLAKVNIVKEGENALPLQNHVHLPQLTKLGAVQKISNCYSNITKTGAKVIGKATGCIVKSFSSLAR